MKTRKILFTVIAKRWFDRINGNTYHSVRCVRHKDSKIIVGQFQYGYGDCYRQTALEIMCDAKWLPKQYNRENMWRYERENNYPILWDVSDGLKKDCIANGIL